MKKLMHWKIKNKNLSFPSPDRSGNPFAFSFKKQKIGTDSGKKLQKIITNRLYLQLYITIIKLQ